MPPPGRDFGEALGAGLIDDRVDRLGSTAAALVEQYAATAPQPLKNEAVLRFAAYLADAGSGAIAKESVGPLSLDRVTNHAAMFRNSGAAALLSRWRVRRAGAIG